MMLTVKLRLTTVSDAQHRGFDLPAFFGLVIVPALEALRGPAFSDHYAGESAAVVIARVWHERRAVGRLRADDVVWRTF